MGARLHRLDVKLNARNRPQSASTRSAKILAESSTSLTADGEGKKKKAIVILVVRIIISTVKS